MTEESGNKKRIISLGFERPERLKEDIIYVDFQYRKGLGQVSATAYSNEKFTYHPTAIAGNRLTRSERYATTSTDGVESSWESDYNEFIKDLTESNNGSVVHQRLIEDGSKLVTKILQSRELLNIKFPNMPGIGTEEKP
jgi:hypothetical protein